jgi:hypothetical protein
MCCSCGVGGEGVKEVWLEGKREEKVEEREEEGQGARPV